MNRTGQTDSGRKPRGHSQSDETILEDVVEVLAANLDASKIEVTIENGEVRLRGNVHDRVEKRLAEEITAGIRGVCDVINMLRIAGQ